MSGFYSKNNSGLTLLEALVATVIVGIGFVAVFQMVQYSIRSIDVSSDRNKGNYLVNLIAEDVLSHKRSTKENEEFADYLKDNQFSIQQCTNEFGLDSTITNTPQNKVQYWQQYFDRGITKCRSNEDIRALNIIDVCNSATSEDKNYVCKYENLIDNSQFEIKKMIEFCDLDWDPNCLNHQSNQSGIKTASVNQARRPIYNTSKNLNKNYSDNLVEMFGILKN